MTQVRSAPAASRRAWNSARAHRPEAWFNPLGQFITDLCSSRDWLPVYGTPRITASLGRSRRPPR